MCAAHGIAHQVVRTKDDLELALQMAWGLNKHSVVEVVTSRDANVEDHRAIQHHVREAVAAAYRLIAAGPSLPGSAWLPVLAPPGSISDRSCHSSAAEGAL